MNHTCTPTQLSRLRGEEPQAPKQKPAPKLSSRPLGDVQRSVLQSLLDGGGKWPGPWVWDTDSGTCRILDALAQRCLVDKEDRGEERFPVFTINENGRKALEAGT